MAIPLLALTSDRHEVVWTGDPAVDGPEGFEGWLPKDGTSLANGATVVTVRPLNGEERMRSVMSLHEGDVIGYAYRGCDLGCVAVDGQTDAVRVAFRRFPEIAVIGLMRYIMAVTSGLDPVKTQADATEAAEQATSGA